MTSSEYAKDWPLTVDTARLCCRFRAVWVEVNGKKYGVNGTARPLLKKYGFECPDLNEIWKDHPDKEKWLEASGTDGEDIGWKVSIHRLIQDGLALVLQRQFREGCGVMPAWRRGAWHGSVWPVRYCPAYPQATAATRLARTVPGAAFPAPPGRPAAS